MATFIVIVKITLGNIVVTYFTSHLIEKPILG